MQYPLKVIEWARLSWNWFAFLHATAEVFKLKLFNVQIIVIIKSRRGFNCLTRLNTSGVNAYTKRRRVWTVSGFVRENRIVCTMVISFLQWFVVFSHGRMQFRCQNSNKHGMRLFFYIGASYIAKVEKQSQYWLYKISKISPSYHGWWSCS